MTFDASILAGIEPRDVLGAQVAAVAAGILAGVLVWHAISMARQGRWAEWTCWSAAALAGITGVWLIALLTSRSFDNAWTKLALLTLLAMATAIIFYHAVYHYLGPARILLLLSLRCLAILVLVVLLFKPTMVTLAGLHARPALVVLIDRSQSMGEADMAAGQGSGVGGLGSGGNAMIASSGPDSPAPAGAGDAAHRQQRLAAVVTAINSERSRLENYFDVKYYAFDKSAEPVDGARLGELKPIGEGTYIDAALAMVAPLLEESRCKGAVLISDGGHNGPRPAAEAVELLKKPLVTVCVGGPVPGGSAGRDVEIEQVTSPDQAICKNVAEVKFDVRSTGFAGRQVTAVLRQIGGEEMARTTLDLIDKTVPVKLEFTPRQVGVMDLELAVGQVSTSARTQADGPRTQPDERIVPLDGEIVAGNNRHSFSVRVGEPRVKVLYVDLLRPELRHLVHTLGSDPQLELMTLTMVALPGTALNPSTAVKFDVAGSVGGKQLQGMPATAEQFKLFDVIVLGDLDRTFLSDSQMKLMHDWVFKDGKGLLMIGGSHSFGPGGYGGTPIEKILPVELGPRTIGQETMPFKLQLTGQGRVHAIFSGLADLITPLPEAGVSPLPELTGCVKVLRVQPGGEVLAVHPLRKTPDGQSLLPVLTVKSYGSGRSAAFTADTTWNWAMKRTQAAYEGVHQRFWGQLARWLAASELVDHKMPPAAVLTVPRSYFTPAESLPLTARVWDQDGPAEGCHVTVTVEPSRERELAGGAENGSSASAGSRSRIEIELPAVKPSGDSGTGSQGGTGLYQAILPPQPPGVLRLTLTATKAGHVLGTNQRKVEIGVPGAELVARSANPDLMRTLADARPGLVEPGSLPLSGFPQLVDHLVAQYQRRPSAEPERLWPSYDDAFHGLAMLLFIVLLSAEWLLRRRWQLQ